METSIAHPDLLREIRLFCEARGVPKSRFGLEAVRDPSLVTQIEQGRELRRKTVMRVRQYMEGAEAERASHQTSDQRREEDTHSDSVARAVE